MGRYVSCFLFFLICLLILDCRGFDMWMLDRAKGSVQCRDLGRGCSEGLRLTNM